VFAGVDATANAARPQSPKMPDEKLLEVQRVNGGQGQNRTADTRIFGLFSVIPGAY